jgi:transposase InsO family protein
MASCEARSWSLPIATAGTVYRMIHMRLRLEGGPVNVERVYWLYREENLMVRRRRRRKLAQPERQPFSRPAAPNEVWCGAWIICSTKLPTAGA